jgi:hypothetical protein
MCLYVFYVNTLFVRAETANDVKKRVFWFSDLKKIANIELFNFILFSQF